MRKKLQILSALFFVSVTLFAQTDNNNLFSKMRISTSGNSVYYYDQSSPKSTKSKAFYIYVIKPNNEKPYLMVRFQYHGSSPIGVYAYELMTDKHNSFNVTPPVDLIKKSGNNYDEFGTYCDLEVDRKFQGFLREIIKAENPKLEYRGTKDNLTVKISESEVKAISNVLSVYDSLNK
jgi:hypothetical protein